MARHRGPQEARPDVHYVWAVLPARCWHRGYSDAHSISVPKQSLPLPSSFQSTFHSAWHDDGFFRWHAARFWLRELSSASHDRSARSGLPATERVRLLVKCVRRFAALLQLHWRRGHGRSWKRSGRRLVRLRSAHGESFFQRPQHRLLDSRPDGQWLRFHRHSSERFHDHIVYALPGHDPFKNATAGVAEPGHERDGAPRCQPARSEENTSELQ